MDGALTLFMVLFGCSDDMSQCQRIDGPPTSFASASICNAQEPAALATKEAMSADYPTIIARCLSGKQLAALDNRTIDLSEPSRRPPVGIYSNGKHRSGSD
jgi:hypothetical protein